MSLKLIDVDGNTLSTAAGYVTVLVLTTKTDLAKAQLVGDRVPDFCLANPAYQMITIVQFGKHTPPVRAFIQRMTRRRLDAEAKRLQVRYDAHKIAHDARQNVSAVADFDGTTAPQLINNPPQFRALVLGRKGELLRQWNDVPTAEELAAALK